MTEPMTRTAMEVSPSVRSTHPAGSSSAARRTAVVSHNHAQGRCAASAAGLFPASPGSLERFHGLVKSFVVLVIEPSDLQR
jgi:hypothetical protein